MTEEGLDPERVDAACRAIRHAIARQSSKVEFDSIVGLTEAEHDRASKMVALELTMGDKGTYHYGDWDMDIPPDVAEAFKRLDDDQS